MRIVAAFVALAMTISASHAATLTVLASFNGQNGAGPRGSLIADAAGNLFGTTELGGASGFGTVFKLDKSGTLTTLASFNGQNGAAPLSSLIFDASGSLLGTTAGDGAFGFGTIFKLSPAGVLTTVVDFDFQNGAAPFAGLIADKSGNFFGTTAGGGAFGFGTVFKLSPNGTLTTLASFDLGSGSLLRGSLVSDAAGNLFGTTEIGGGVRSAGTVFKLDTNGVLTTLIEFDGQNGSLPQAGLVFDNAGNLYGTTEIGGAFGLGTVFKIDKNGVLTTLVNFDGNNGATPRGNLIIDAAGNIFGTTVETTSANSGGLVFKIDKSGNLSTIVEFNGINGAQSFAGLLADAAGNLFGTTVFGGAFGEGTVFRVSDAGFVVSAAIPEPASWAMMLVGFGLVGGALRRRQRRAPVKQGQLISN